MKKHINPIKNSLGVLYDLSTEDVKLTSFLNALTPYPKLSHRKIDVKKENLETMNNHPTCKSIGFV